MQKTCYIRTFGCQMNEHDSQKMRLLLAPLGFTFIDTPETADLIIFNTCTIREKAYHKAISEIGRARFFKKHHKGKVIAVCGCVAQQEGSALVERFGHVDIMFGPDQIAELPRLLEELHNSTGVGEALASPIGRLKSPLPFPVTALNLINNAGEYNFINLVPKKVESGSAFVTVAKGCNCSCSYCIVPSVRGHEVCRSSDDVISEVKNLVKAGVKEVTLLGQNVTAYKYNKETLASLIHRLSDETNILRIRFMSPNPKDATDELIDEYAKNPKLCPHIHLPAQSGSDTMLKKMRRGYTREKYLEIVEKLRKARPEISITSDFIVGFCEEGEKEFEETVDLLKHVQFDSIFAFKYSPRPGTLAAKEFEDGILKDIKESRLDRVLSLQRKITRAKNESLVGQTGKILVTGPARHASLRFACEAGGPDRKGSGSFMGRLPDNRIVNFAGNASMLGAILRVRLTRALANSMEGKVLDD